MWVWSSYGNRFEHDISTALDVIKNDPRRGRDKNYHWEFVRFGLDQAQAQYGVPAMSIRSILGLEKFVGTRVANWTLLRASVRLRSPSKIRRAIGHIEALAAILFFQTKGGVIEDQRNKPTLQYHAFSAALLGLLLDRPGLFTKVYRRAFAKAIGALDALTLRGGDMNYVGRGQGQTFGYASAILAFCLAGKHLGDARWYARAAEVLEYVERYKRPDGGLPLVLRQGEEDAASGEPRTPTDARFLGWYSHNNYYDYLPFTGALLRLSAHILVDQVSDVLPQTRRPQQAITTRLDDFLIVNGPHYGAVVMPPKPYLPSSQPFPFIEVDGHYPLTCYGGEVKPPGLYTASSLPLPIMVEPNGRRHTLDTRRFKWTRSTTYEGGNDHFALRRHLVFTADEVTVEDEVSIRARHEGWRVVSPRLLLPQTAQQRNETTLLLPGLSIKSDQPLIKIDDPEYCAVSILNVYGAEIAVPNGESYVVRSKVQLTPDPLRVAA
jgi:hypothetical protein